MNILVPVMLFGWIPVVLALFLILPPRRAVIVAFLFAWLFLPVAGYEIEGLPDYTKTSATSFGVLLSILLFDSNRMIRFRPGFIDVVMLIWCLMPFATSISNEMGVYGGVSLSSGHIVTWGIPWLIGRLYFSDLEGLRELAIGVLIGGLIYIPFCLFEIRMSPNLHYFIYGYHQHSFAQQFRYGGYRPMVFMQHGLAVGVWMASATVVGLWLWLSGSLRRFWNVPLWWFVLALAITTVLCKSTGAIALCAGMVMTAFSLYWFRTRMVLIAMILFPVAYIATRLSGGWYHEYLVDGARLFTTEVQVGSLAGRMWNEELFIEHTMERPILGWSPWFFLVYDAYGYRLTTPDSMWILAFAQFGLVGLTSLFSALLLSPARLAWYCRARVLNLPVMGPVVALGLAGLLFILDLLFNAMPNPILVLALGGIAGLPLEWSRSTTAIGRGSIHSMGS